MNSIEQKTTVIDEVSTDTPLIYNGVEYVCMGSNIITNDDEVVALAEGTEVIVLIDRMGFRT